MILILLNFTVICASNSPDNHEVDIQSILSSHRQWVNSIPSLYYAGKFESGKVIDGNKTITQNVRRVSAVDNLRRSVEGLHYDPGAKTKTLDLIWSRTLSTPQNLYVFWETNRIIEVTSVENNPEVNPKVSDLFRDAYWESLSWFAPNFDRFNINSPDWLTRHLETLISMDIPYKIEFVSDVQKLKYKIDNLEVCIYWNPEYEGTISRVIFHDIIKNYEVEYSCTNFQKIKKGVWLPFTVTRRVTSHASPSDERFWTINLTEATIGDSAQMSDAFDDQYQPGSIVHLIDSNDYKYVPGGIDLLDTNIEHVKATISKSQESSISNHLNMIKIVLVIVVTMILSFYSLRVRRKYRERNDH